MEGGRLITAMLARNFGAKDHFRVALVREWMVGLKCSYVDVSNAGDC